MLGPQRFIQSQVGRRGRCSGCEATLLLVLTGAPVFEAVLRLAGGACLPLGKNICNAQARCCMAAGQGRLENLDAWFNERVFSIVTSSSRPGAAIPSADAAARISKLNKAGPDRHGMRLVMALVEPSAKFMSAKLPPVCFVISRCSFARVAVGMVGRAC